MTTLVKPEFFDPRDTVMKILHNVCSCKNGGEADVRRVYDSVAHAIVPPFLHEHTV